MTEIHPYYVQGRSFRTLSRAMRNFHNQGPFNTAMPTYSVLTPPTIRELRYWGKVNAGEMGLIVTEEQQCLVTFGGERSISFSTRQLPPDTPFALAHNHPTQGPFSGLDLHNKRRVSSIILETGILVSARETRKHLEPCRYFIQFADGETIGDRLYGDLVVPNDFGPAIYETIMEKAGFDIKQQLSPGISFFTSLLPVARTDQGWEGVTIYFIDWNKLESLLKETSRSITEIFFFSTEISALIKNYFPTPQLSQTIYPTAILNNPNF